MSADERVDVVDADDRVVRTASRGEVRRHNLPHRSVYILVFNSAGALFIHRRSAHKDVFPGYWDVAAGGVVAAGEDYDTAAERELHEELGIAGTPLQTLFRFRYEDPQNRVFGAVYACTWDGPLELQPTEIEAGEWVDPQVPVQPGGGRRFCPDSLEALPRYLAEHTG